MPIAAYRFHRRTFLRSSLSVRLCAARLGSTDGGGKGVWHCSIWCGGTAYTAIEKAHIIVGQDTDAMSDPLSANMEWAVKFDKPDFLGKPSLMRISTEGPKQLLVGFKMVEPDVVPDEGLQIVDPEADGQLKSLVGSHLVDSARL